VWIFVAKCAPNRLRRAAPHAARSAAAGASTQQHRQTAHHATAPQPLVQARLMRRFVTKTDVFVTGGRFCRRRQSAQIRILIEPRRAAQNCADCRQADRITSNAMFLFAALCFVFCGGMVECGL